MSAAKRRRKLRHRKRAYSRGLRMSRLLLRGKRARRRRHWRLLRANRYLVGGLRVPPFDRRAEFERARRRQYFERVSSARACNKGPT